MNIEFKPIKDLPLEIKTFTEDYKIPREVSPYQYAPWQENVVKNFQSSYGLKHLVRAEFCTYKNNGAAAIFPFQYNRFSKNGEIMLFGSGGMSDYLNLIYNEQFSYEDFILLIRAVTQRTGRKSFYFNLLQEKTRTYDYVQRLAVRQDECNICVRIALPSSYDAYYSSLSKSTRQNVRTAINRMNKQGLNSELRLFTNSDITSEIVQDMLEIYAERYEKKNQYNRLSMLQNVKKFLMQGKRNLISDALGKTEGSLVAAEYIEGKMAAYAFMLFDRDRKIVCVPRVATAEAFYFFSPGMLLFVDFIREVYQKNPLIDKIEVIDLTNGDETYKFRLNGISDNPTHKIYFSI